MRFGPAPAVDSNAAYSLQRRPRQGGCGTAIAADLLTANQPSVRRCAERHLPDGNIQASSKGKRPDL